MLCCSGTDSVKFADRGIEEVPVVKPLVVKPSELHLAARRIDGQATDFAVAHRSALWRASQAALGSGLSGAALPQLAEVWQTDASEFGAHFTNHAAGHRAAAAAYLHTESESARELGNSGVEL